MFRSMEKRSRFFRLLLIAPITGTAATGFSAIVPALPELAKEFGVSIAAIGFLQTSAAVPGIFFTPVVGYLADRFGKRRAIVTMLIAFGVFGTAGAFASDFGTLLALRMLMGVPYAGLLALTPAMVGDLFEADERRRAIGFNTASLTLASTVAPIVGGILATGGSQRAFLVYTLAFPVALLSLLLPAGSRTATRRGRGEGARAVAELRRRGTLIDVVGSFPYTVIFMAVFVGFSFVVVPVLLSDLGLGTAARGPIVGAANLGSATASLVIAGSALGRRPSRSVVAAQVFALSGLVTLAFSGRPEVAVIGVLLLGLSIGATYNAMQLFVTSASPPENRGLVVGAWSASTRIGQVLGGLLCGLLVTLVEARIAFLVGAGVILILFLSWRPIRRVANGREHRSAMAASRSEGALNESEFNRFQHRE